VIAVLQRFRRMPAASAALAVALLLAGCAAALPERPDIVNGSGLFWRVEKPGLEPSYVFGTMHVPDPDLRDLPPPVAEALSETKQTAFELVTPPDKAMREHHRFLAAAQLPEDQSLKDLLDGPTYAQLLRIARRQRPSTERIGAWHISRFKPWFVMLVIGKNDASAAHLDPAEPSLDDWLEAQARKAGDKIVGLESFEEQLGVFDGMPMSDQVALLGANLDNYNRWRSYDVSKQLYLTGDTAMFYGIWQEELEAVEPAVARRTLDRFLDDRNHKMVARMLPLMEEQPSFMAVGALHLPGEEGVLALLEREGYTVTRLY